MNKPRRLFVAGMIAVFWPQGGEAVNQIDTPADETNYFQTSNIATDGDRNMGEAVRVKLQIDMNIGADSGILGPGPPMGITWAHNFPFPGSGWGVSDDWDCVLYNDVGDISDTNPYNVIAGP